MMCLLALLILSLFALLLMSECRKTTALLHGSPISRKASTSMHPHQQRKSLLRKGKWSITNTSLCISAKFGMSHHLAGIHSNNIHTNLKHRYIKYVCMYVCIISSYTYTHTYIHTLTH